MKVSEARAAVGGLSQTSKMPCKSWGISAKACKTGGKLAKVEGTVCHGCYALKGAYVWPVVEKAHAKGMKVILDWVANHTSWDNVWTANPEWYSQDSLGNFYPPVPDWSDVIDLNYDNQTCAPP